VLNFLKYRDQFSEDERRLYLRDKQRVYRARKKAQGGPIPGQISHHMASEAGAAQCQLDHIEQDSLPERLQQPDE